MGRIVDIAWMERYKCPEQETHFISERHLFQFHHFQSLCILCLIRQRPSTAVQKWDFSQHWNTNVHLFRPGGPGAETAQPLF